ncbi:hypothetical protein [Streptomyces sp. KN37]|uniref:hypothetical protein n=1 Tax=Streptomyces sp. 135 TaxID=2838850 RepID=UPI002A758CB6|nr:hypothetical protein [Streptomyces sp. KN37]WPO69333.1 hypothetical protein R9806_01110 [Streptomyces sp. KN37]
MFLLEEDLPKLAPGTLVIDVSCDEGMGFAWARPTSFDEPMFTVGDHVHHYGVDHSSSYLWDAATWENSEALVPFLRPVLEGPTCWDGDCTLLSSRGENLQPKFEHSGHISHLIIQRNESGAFPARLVSCQPENFSG